MRDDEKSKAELLEELKALRAKTGGQPLMEATECCNHIIEAMPVAVVILDMEGRIRQVNREFEKSSGWRREEAEGRTGAELGIVEDEEGRRVEEEISPRLMREGSVANVETTIIRKDGTSFPALASYTLMRDDDGKPAGVVIVTRDITDISRAREELHESEAKWRSLVANAPDVIVVLDRDGTVQFINHTVSGISTKEVVGRSLYDFLPAESCEIHRKSLERVFETGEGDAFETAGVTVDGRRIWFESRVGSIKREGRVVAAVIISADITERKRLGKRWRSRKKS